jgi:cyclopropane fatty-acyl-phospholipid synthase-like methyltransferase
MIELNRYLRSQLTGTWFHNTDQDASYLPEAYNKGDDWFEATLGEPMVYTSAIYQGANETMWSAQLNKLEFIAHALGVKPGDKALEIGAGWGRLANHLASKGADVTGVVMASDQQKYAQGMSKKLGNKNVEIKLKNFFDLENPPKSFNVISAVEMAEHVGIRNYHTFLRKVHSLLADDGTFYIQASPLVSFSTAMCTVRSPRHMALPSWLGGRRRELKLPRGLTASMVPRGRHGTAGAG